MQKIFKKVASVSKKVFIVAAVYFVIATLFFSFAGDGSVSKPNVTERGRKQIYQTLNNKDYQKTKEGRSLLYVYKTVNCGLLGEGCTNNPADGDKNFSKSFFGFMTNTVTIAYRSPPASGIYWVQDGLRQAGFIPKSYAAEGIGVGALKPISGLWKKVRDFALIIMVFILVTIGFLIMFRVKINPQTAITLENSLPRIFFSLLLIVFSFAIAGFLIDLMYIVTAISVAIIDKDSLKSLLTGSTGKLFDAVFLNGNILELGPDLMSLMPSLLGQALRLIISGFAFTGIMNIPAVSALRKVGDGVVFANGIIDVYVSLLLSTIVFIILQPALPYILSILILVTGGLIVFFRIVILLLSAYIRIILMVIFAPIILILEAIPGRKMLSFWLKNLVADLAAFTITAVLIVVSGKIVNTTDTGNLWQPPFLYSVGANSFPGIIGMAILFAIPNIIKKFREILGIKPSGIFGPSLFFTGAAAGAGGGAGIASKFMDLRYKAQWLPAPILNLARGLPGFKSLGESQADRLRKKATASTVKDGGDEFGGGGSLPPGH